MKAFLVSLLLILLPGWLFSQVNWIQDDAHSWLKFEVEHIVVLPDMLEEEGYTMGFTGGTFENYTVNLKQEDPDRMDFEIEVVLQVASINTENSARDLHLKSADFFDADQYPVITFVSTDFVRTGQNTFELIGDLTIKDVTEVVTLEGHVNNGVVDGQEQPYLSFAADGIIFRNEYNLVWGELIEQGGFRVSNYVNLEIQANFMQIDRIGSNGN